MSFPTFSPGDILTAADMNAVGWWLMKSDTVPAASASHICSNAFSSSYTDYLIIIRGLTVTAGSATVTMQGRAAGVTTTTNYASAGSNDNYAAATRIASSATAWTVGYCDTTAMHSCYIQISNPQAAVRTTMFSTGASNIATHWTGGYQNSTTQFDAFVLTPSASTFSAGTIRVYGYKA